jgi:hypothetical protein
MNCAELSDHVQQVINVDFGTTARVAAESGERSRPQRGKGVWSTSWPWDYRPVTNLDADSVLAGEIAAAWQRVVFDCGCPDLYYCPQASDIECPRHGGFATCCAHPSGHVSVR